MPPPIKKLADRFLSNPKSIEVSRPAATNALITERIVEVDARKKREVLRRMIESEKVTTAIIFCNRKTTVRELAKSLKEHGYRAGEIHGDMDQSSRIKELDFFKSGAINILVASDVAARGLDVKGVSHVFNFDAPWHPDDYVHRIGRTGRAGAKGAAFTFVTKADEDAIAQIEKLTNHKIERIAKSAQASAADDQDDAPETKPARASKPRRGAKPKPVETAHQTATTDLSPRPKTAKPPRSQSQRNEPQRDEPQPDRPKRNARDDTPDDGWNGPLPGFLSVSLNR